MIPEKFCHSGPCQNIDSGHCHIFRAFANVTPFFVGLSIVEAYIEISSHNLPISVSKRNRGADDPPAAFRFFLVLFGFEFIQSHVTSAWKYTLCVVWCKGRKAAFHSLIGPFSQKEILNYKNYKRLVQFSWTNRVAVVWRSPAFFLFHVSCNHCAMVRNLTCPHLLGVFVIRCNGNRSGAIIDEHLFTAYSR